jgi:hypothetical protein
VRFARTSTMPCIAGHPGSTRRLRNRIASSWYDLALAIL